MRRFKDKFKDFWASPTAFDCAGILFIPPKLLLTAIFVISACFWIKSEDLLSSIAMLTYPVVGLSMDVFLYAFRKQIWPHLPDAALIPAEWQITPSQLQQYAQCLPKVRFMRALMAVMIAPIFAILNEGLSLESLSISFGGLFCWGALFDRCWLKRLNLQAPKPPQRLPSENTNRWMDDDEDRLNRARQSDCTIPGTPAWSAIQDIGPVTTSSHNWMNDNSHMPLPMNPTHLGSNTRPFD